MNILILTEYFPESEEGKITGGVEARSYYLGRELARRHQVTIISSWKQGQKRKDILAGMRIIRCGPHHPYTNSGGVYSRLRFAWSALKTGKELKDLDLVEGNNFISYLPAFYIARHHGLPSIATYNEVWLGSWVRNKGVITGTLGNMWERMALSRPWNGLIAISNFTRERLLENGISPDKITVIPIGIDLREIDNIPGEKDELPTICYVGRLIAQKRVEDLIYAISIAKKDIADLRCRIIGQGSEMARLKGLAVKLGIETAIDFMGYMDNRQELLRIMKEANIFCLPSVLEGFGIAVIEAGACGIPSVVSDIEPFQEITQGGKGGLFFRKKDPIDLAKKIVELLSDRTLYQEKAEEARELAESYVWEKLTERVESLYRSLV